MWSERRLESNAALVRIDGRLNIRAYNGTEIAKPTAREEERVVLGLDLVVAVGNAGGR